MKTNWDNKEILLPLHKLKIPIETKKYALYDQL